MSVRCSALPIAVSILLAACLGPTGRPITAPVPAGTAVQIRAEHDTLQLRWTDAIAADSGRALICATQRIDGAIVIAPAASVTIVQPVPVSAPVQIGGSLLIIGAVAGFSLLLFNAADGLFGIIERWF